MNRQPIRAVLRLTGMPRLRAAAPPLLVALALAAAGCGSRHTSAHEDAISAGSAAQPSGHQSPVGRARSIVKAGKVIGVSADARGDVAAVYEQCSHGCTHAIAVRRTDGSTRLALTLAEGEDGWPAVPGGWLATDSRGRPIVVGRDARSRPVPVAPGEGTPRPGDLAVRLDDGWGLYRSSTATVERLRPPSGGRLLAARVTASGDVVGSLSLPHRQRATGVVEHDGRWTRTTLDRGDGVASGFVAAGRGDTVALDTTRYPSSWNGVDASPVDVIATTRDGGHTFDRTRVYDPGHVVEEELSLAIDRHGRVVATLGGRLVRNTRDGRSVDLGSSHASAVFASGPALYLVPLRGPRLMRSLDDGRTFTALTLPGRS